MMTGNKLPQQSIPLSKKTEEWKKQTVDALAEKANYNFGGDVHREKIAKLYDYYNGKIDDKDYEYVLEPYGRKRENFPAKIRNFPLIKPSVDLLVGEKAKRPFNFTVVVHSEDVESVKMMAMSKEINENLQKWMVAKLNEAGFDTGQETDEELQLPEEVERIFSRNWRDNRAIMAQKALEFLIPYLKYHDKMQKGWFDFLVSGYVVTHKGAVPDNVFYEIENPLEIYYDKDPREDFIEDGNWAVLKSSVSRASAIDHYRTFLTDEEVTRLESPRHSYVENLDSVRDLEENEFSDTDDYMERIIVYWKSLKKVGFRKYIDEFGEVLEEVVEEDYKRLPEDIELEWGWINEVWEGHRLDGDIYIKVQPLEAQRSSIDNPSKCKLPINGRAYSNRNSENISLVALGIPYQLSYNVFKYRLENAIAKSRDILALLDINMIPKGWTMDKFMTILESTGIGWVNYQKEGMQFNPQHQSILDMSIKTVDQYINLLRFIKEEWEFVSGVSRQRLGEIGQYEGKATGEQAIIQSSHITEEYYRKFYEVEQRDIQGILDFSQIAFVDGKRGSYVTTEGYQEFLNIDPDTFVNEEFGVFVKDANKEKEKLDGLKSLGQAAVQNGSPLSLVANMIGSDNFAELKGMIDEAEKNMEELEQQAQEMEQQQTEAILQDKAEEREFLANENELDRQNKIDIALIQKEFDNIDETSTTEAEIKRRKLDLEERFKEKDINEKIRSNKAKERISQAKLQIDRAKARSTNK